MHASPGIRATAGQSGNACRGVADDLRRSDWIKRDQLPRLSLEVWPSVGGESLTIEGGEISNAIGAVAESYISQESLCDATLNFSIA
jgi:hypothetical protein